MVFVEKHGIIKLQRKAVKNVVCWESNRDKGEKDMRKWSIPLLLMLLLMAGCGAQRAGEGPVVDAAEAQAALDAAQTQDQARPLTEEEILDAYDRAVTAYGWFDLQPLPTGEESKTVDGRTYWRVDYPGIENMTDLQTCLKDVFCEELVKELLTGESGGFFEYREVDGALYGPVGGRTRDRSRGEIRTEVVSAGETAYTVHVSVDLLDEDLVTVAGMESYVFPYELINGRWVFTQFQMVY